jgi:hypothetical protein
MLHSWIDLNRSRHQECANEELKSCVYAYTYACAKIVVCMSAFLNCPEPKPPSRVCKT